MASHLRKITPGLAPGYYVCRIKNKPAIQGWFDKFGDIHWKYRCQKSPETGQKRTPRGITTGCLILLADGEDL